MHWSHLRYLPISPPFFSILIGIFFLVVVLIEVGALRYAFMGLGVSSGVALLLFLGSLFGSYFNIRVAELPEQRVMAGAGGRVLWDAICNSGCR
ncbi:MAG: hypothetical protein ACREDT_02625 [Methylocella sp.]